SCIHYVSLAVLYLCSSLFFFMSPPPPRSTLFPYTTLFRSSGARSPPGGRAHAGVSRRRGEAEDRRDPGRHPAFRGEPGDGRLTGAGTVDVPQLSLRRAGRGDEGVGGQAHA